MLAKRTLAAFVAATACLLAVSASAQTGQKPAKPPQRNFTPYPAEVRANFMPACTSGGTLSEATCGCVHRNLERELTLAEYIDLDKAAGEKKDHPLMPRMTEILIACYADPTY
jgi:hypothetical protein